jgi:RNA polymerase sigma factor (sigma-70 family)
MFLAFVKHPVARFLLHHICSTLYHLGAPFAEVEIRRSIFRSPAGSPFWRHFAPIANDRGSGASRSLCIVLTGQLCNAGVVVEAKHAAMNSDGLTPAGQFTTTRWSVVLLAGQEVSPESAAALEKLCRTYWQPVCAFARRKGWSEEDAKDLTQQFFVRLLERNDFSGVDPRKGKFRTFLLTAFTHFLTNEFDRVNALKRGGGRTIISLDQFSPDQLGGVPPAEEFSPGTIYDLRWAQTIVQTALEQLKEEMSKADKASQFAGLKRFLTANAAPGEYAQTAEQLGVETSSVPVLVHRLRQRYRELVRDEVAQTVSSPVELEEEMRYLLAVLNQ